MFQSRVSGLGTPVARLNDGTETTFYPAGKKYSFTSRISKIVMENGVQKEVQGPPSAAVMYDLQVTVKDYVLGSGKVKHTDWGSGLYPGYNPMPNWVTIPEEQFVAMYPEWVDIRNAKFGSSIPTPKPAPSPAPTPAPTAPAGFSLPLLLGAAYLLLS
jgi:hypothetical protein